MFAELVCGPPGSGKTTYCEGRRQFLSLLDDRVVCTINLDPANDGVFPYPCDINIADLVDQSTVMEKECLGPNGSYLFCIDYLAERLDWLVDQIRSFVQRANSPKPVWLLIDCPGQVEYYLHSESMGRVVRTLQKTLRCNVCVVHLCDAAIATRDVSTYVSTCLLALCTMTDLELPHVNVLTKWDTVVPAGDDGAEMEAYLDTANFKDDHFLRLWKQQVPSERRSAFTSEPRFKLAMQLLDVIDGYGMLSFVPLNVQDARLMDGLHEQIEAGVAFNSL